MTIPAVAVRPRIGSLLMTLRLTLLGYAAGHWISLDTLLSHPLCPLVYISLDLPPCIVSCLMPSFGLQLFSYIRTDTKTTSSAPLGGLGVD